MSETVKKKAVHVIRLTETDSNGKTKMVNGKPVFKDIQPGTTFSCPKALVAELAKSGSIAAPGRVTAVDAASTKLVEDAEILDDAEEDDDDASTEDDDDATVDVAGMDHGQLVAHAKSLKIKATKSWGEVKLREEIAKVAPAGEDDEEDVL
jgi:hypothetical protein